MFPNTGNLPDAVDVVPGRASAAAGPNPHNLATLVIGRIQSASGIVTLTRADGAVVPGKAGDLVCRGDVIETTADGVVGIIFCDGTLFNLSEGGRLAVD